MGIFGGASFTSTTTSPLISLDNTSLKLTTNTQAALTDHGDVVAVGGLGSSDGATFSRMTLSGPLLSTSNGSALNTTGSLALVFTGGQIVETHPTSPFVSISGGTHTIASDSGNALFRLFGRSTATTTETVNTVASPTVSTGTSTLSLGTDQPLVRSGSGAFLAMAGGTLTTDSVLTLDTALLAASAPLLNLKSNATLTSSADGINLVQNAKLTAVGPLVKLDGSTLNITGHAIRAMGGSLLDVSGDLFSLANASKLNLTNGGALFISGGSVVKISGALVNFGGSGGNQLNISNTFTPNGGCSVQCGGLSVSTQNGGSLGNVSITSPIKNGGLGTVTLSSGSHIILDGTTSKIIIVGN
jgi:hypothetical protein